MLIELLNENSIKMIIPFPVSHCIEASGIRLEMDSKTIVFSGDTKYTESLINYSKNANLIIHECTFDCSEEK